MSHTLQSYKINAPRVVHQIIDGEAVIIDFETGAYFSIDQSGAQVWALLEKGLSLDEIIEQFAFHYHLPTVEVSLALQAFIAQLSAERLIAPTESLEPLDLQYESIFIPGQDFIPPSLQKYTDMQDLLLLDPIHEVDESGWPTPKPRENA